MVVRRPAMVNVVVEMVGSEVLWLPFRGFKETILVGNMRKGEDCCN